MLSKNKSRSVSKKSNSNLRIAIVASKFYDGLIDNMKKSCIEYLVKSGVKEKNIHVFYAPGSWEIPLITQNIAKKNKFDGIITLGIIIKGKTYHYKILAEECSKALMNISLQNNIPVAFEILVVENIALAEKRVKGKYNKGTEGSKAVLDTINTLKLID